MVLQHERGENESVKTLFLGMIGLLKLAMECQLSTLFEPRLDLTRVDDPHVREVLRRFPVSPQAIERLFDSNLSKEDLNKALFFTIVKIIILKIEELRVSGEIQKQEELKRLILNLDDYIKSEAQKAKERLDRDHSDLQMREHEEWIRMVAFSERAVRMQLFLEHYSQLNKEYIAIREKFVYETAGELADLKVDGKKVFENATPEQLTGAVRRHYDDDARLLAKIKGLKQKRADLMHTQIFPAEQGSHNHSAVPMFNRQAIHKKQSEFDEAILNAENERGGLVKKHFCDEAQLIKPEDLTPEKIAAIQSKVSSNPAVEKGAEIKFVMANELEKIKAEEAASKAKEEYRSGKEEEIFDLDDFITRADLAVSIEQPAAESSHEKPKT